MKLIEQIVTVEPFVVVGMRYEGPMKAEKEISKLWEKFNRRKQSIKNIAQENVSYGVFRSSDEQVQKGELTYLASLPVIVAASLPEGMIAFDVAGGEFAKFCHIGELTSLPETFDYIFQNWLPNSKYVLDGRAAFELYDHRFRGNCKESAFDIFIPIKLK